MANVVNFNMLVEINQLLKEKKIDYSIHSVGGCTCSGLQLRQDGEPYLIEEIIILINNYLNDKWMRVVPHQDNPLLLNIESKFKQD